MSEPLYVGTYRVWFKKEGRLRYISHLDINRCVSRALKRSGLPVWYTLGFNPHVYITFALPLSLGYESICETMDFRLTREVPMDEVVERLNAVFPMGLTALRAQPAIAPPQEIAQAEYEITLEFEGTSPQNVVQKLQVFCAQEQILTKKRTKKGEKSIDIKPHFSLADLSVQGEQLHFTMRTAAGTQMNINPSLVLDAFTQQSGIKYGWMRVVRTAILDVRGQPFA